MVLVPVPAFQDNYIWVWHNGSHAVVIDPGESAGVEAFLLDNGLQLDSILVTHHHGDHTGGVPHLQAQTGAQVFAPASECPGLSATRVTHGSQLTLLGMPCQVLHVPGHTAGHVAYVVAGDGEPTTLFCGDTLFSAGCGRLFEGSPADMLVSLDTLAGLPGDTRVCCAHEYTLSNIRFALAVEPHNAELQQWQLTCQALRARQQPTLPSTLAQECQINPFLRVRQPSVRQAADKWVSHQPNGSRVHHRPMTDVEVLAALREWKNTF